MIGIVARRIVTRGSRLALSAALVSAASSAAAQTERGGEAPEAQTSPASPPSVDALSEALATELFNAGRDLMAAGRHVEACPKLAESARLSNSVGTLGKLAECEERLGHLVAARSRWQQASNLARVRGDERLDLTERELGRLSSVVPKLFVVLPPVRAADSEVRIDGVVVGASALEVAIPLDPGRHTVAVSGARPWSTVLTLQADGATTRVTVPSTEAPVASAPAFPPAAAAEASPRGVTVLESLGLVAAGAGVLSAGVGAYLAGRTSAGLEASNAAGCEGDRCTVGGAALREDARATGNAATAFLVAGGIAAAGGLTLFLVAPGPRSTSVVGATAAAVSSGGGVAVWGRF